MKRINGSYIIQKEVDNEEFFTGYLVKDEKSKKKSILYILKSGFIYEKSREYLLSKFNTIKNLNFDNMFKLINIKIINNIDGINLDKPQYGFLLEDYDYKKNTKNFIEGCNLKEKLDIFMEVCASINTLNIKGDVYDKININDIKMIVDKNNSIKIKLKNILQNELKKMNLYSSPMNLKLFPYSLYNRDEFSNELNNMNEIINLFNEIFSEEDLNSDLTEIKEIKKFFGYIKTLNKMCTITDFIKYVNNRLKAEYTVFIESGINKPKFNLDIIGREEELNIIEKKFNNILENKDKYNIICFKGENGTGKTKILNEIEYIISNKYLKQILYIKNLEDINLSVEELEACFINFFDGILEKITREKYEYYIKRFMEILIKNKSEIDDNEKLKIANRIVKCISEYSAKNQIVILIDNLEEKHEIIKLLLKYILLLDRNTENIMVVFTVNNSYCDEEVSLLLKQLEKLEKYEEYTINYFNQYNTTKMIKNILNYSKEIDKLSMEIFAKTLGNPQYIISLIEELYNNNYICFDFKSGVWKIDKEFKSIAIPEKIDSKVNFMISSLRESEIHILKKLSIFLTPLPERIILKYVITGEEGIESYNKLKEKNFLADKIGDKGLLVGFTNELLKNILYSKIDEKTKYVMHKNATEFLEEEIYNDDSYVEEFLYNLEKIEEFNKLYFYTIRCAQVEKIYGNPSKSIQYYKKTFKYSDDKNKCNIAINIAKLYECISDHENGLKYFKLANEYSFKRSKKDMQIYTNIEIIIIKMNNFNECNQDIILLLQNIRKQLDEINYPKGEVYYYYALMLKARIEEEYEMILEYGSKVLEILDEFRIKDDVHGWILNTIALEYRRIGIYKQAKKLILNSTRLFENNKNMNGYIFSKNIYTELLKEEGRPIEKIIDNLIEISRLSNRNKLYKREIFSLINIAICYLNIDNYVEAERYITKTLERQRDESVEFYSDIIYSTFCLLQIKLGNIRLAVKYHTLYQMFLNNTKNPEENMIDNSISSYYYNLIFYNYDEAYEILRKIYNKISNKNDYKSRYIVCNYYQMLLLKCENELDVKNIYNILKNKLEYINNINKQIEIKLKAIRFILKLDYRTLANKLFNEIKDYPNNYNMEAYYIYLELYFKDNNSHYNYLINKGLRVCSLSVEKEIKRDLYAIIGEKYSEMECYQLAFYYYYESISLHVETLKELPVKEQLIYINKSNFFYVYRLLVECLNDKLKIRINFKDFHNINNENELNDILNEIKITRLLNNQSIYNLTQGLYERLYYNNLNNAYDLFFTFNEDIIKNLGSIVKYISKITLSNKALLLIENENGENEVVYSYRINNVNTVKSYFNNKIESQDNVLILSENDIYFNNLEIESMKIKGCMYIRIRNEETYLNGSNKINGKLILLSDNAINNINDSSKILVEKLVPFINFMLKKYNLTISSTLDKLTGAYNRRYFEQALTRLLDNEKATNNIFGIIMFDIDDFKGVNDKYGHQTGDEVLVKVVKEVKKSIYKNNIIGRYGGEEFLILIPNADEEKMINLAETIRENIEKAKILGEKRPITVSIGSAIGGNEVLSSRDIISRVDRALYKSKNAGKNKVTFWRKEFDENIEDVDINGGMISEMLRSHNLDLVISDIVNLMKYNITKKERIHQFSLKIINTIKCATIGVFLIEDYKINSTFVTRLNGEFSSDLENFNLNFVDKVIGDGKSIYNIDWNNGKKYEGNSIPEWKSVCLTPVISNGKIIVVLYLYDSINNKEFDNNDCILLNSIAQLSIPVFL